MAVLAFMVAGNAIGTAIGGSFLGIAAAQWGGIAGAMVGNALFGPKTNVEGPRLSDLKVQSSSYGVGLPIVYGTTRIAGNMIWSQPILETRHKKKSGGKGGKQKVTTYTYSQSFAIALCEGPITGISRIWANGKLIYNGSLSANSNTSTSSATFKNDTFRIYYGSETQIADSLIQADVGAANCPAYRGTAYVVFENLQLVDFGNRTPTLEFEVTSLDTATTLTNASGVVTLAENIPQILMSGKYAYIMLPSGDFRVYDISTPTLPTLLYSGDLGVGPTYGLPESCVLGGNYFWWIDGSTFKLRCIDVTNPAAPVLLPTAVSATVAANLIYNKGFIYRMFIIGAPPSSLTVWDVRDPFNVTQTSVTITGVMQSGDMILSGNYLYCVTANSSNRYVVIDVTNPGVPVVLTNITTLSPSIESFFGGIAVKAGKLYVINTGSTAVNVWNLANPLIPVWETSFAVTGSGFVDRTLGDSVLCLSTGGNTSLYSLEDPLAPVLLSSLSNLSSGSFINTTGNVIAPHKTTSFSIVIITGSLSTAVSDICTRAGLLTSEIDVTSLTDTLDGVAMLPNTGRSQIEILAGAYFFDGIESDGKIKFVKRGASPTVTILEDDLAAHMYGEDMPTNMDLARVDDLELPQEVHIQYMDKDVSYQVGTQSDMRQVTNSKVVTTINVALALNGTKAKQIASAVLYSTWAARTTFAFANSYKYAYLDPTDVVNVVKGGTTYTVRITSDNLAAGISARQAVYEDPSSYTQNSNYAALPTPVADVYLAPLITLVMMDIPLLRDYDDGYGFYIAAYASSPGWRGAQIYKSFDNEASWLTFGDLVVNEAEVGRATTTLGNFTGGNIFDETNTVTVVMSSGELASVDELSVLNGLNVGLLGSEIIQYKNAVLTATGTYVLSGLLRGRQGTEWAMGTHTSTDRFIVLEATTTYVEEGASAEYNLSRIYRAVAIDDFLDNALSISFTNTGVAQKPYSPVGLGGGRNAAADVIINWVRRTRVGGSWADNTDVPLGEASEKYELEIWNVGYTILKRTITGLTASTYTYVVADQTTDFGSAQATVYFKVFQISATVGRGYEGKGRI